MIKMIIAIALVVLLSGCASGSRNIMYGLGKREIEYYPDGTVKKETMENKTPFSDIFAIKIGKVGE